MLMPTSCWCWLRLWRRWRPPAGAAWLAVVRTPCFSLTVTAFLCYYHRFIQTSLRSVPAVCFLSASFGCALLHVSSPSPSLPGKITVRQHNMLRQRYTVSDSESGCSTVAHAYCASIPVGWCVPVRATRCDCWTGSGACHALLPPVRNAPPAAPCASTALPPGQLQGGRPACVS